MILVCATTGRIGSRTINRLIDDQKVKAIAAGVRTIDAGQDFKARGVDVRLVDYDARVV